MKTQVKNKCNHAELTNQNYIFFQIVQRYDIILIQGLQDKDLSVTKRLKALVNNLHKERYLFLYRKETVSVKDSFQYTGKGFERPPFVVQFSSRQTAVKEFVLIPIHTRPGSAVK
ncbi:hypothetical protein JOQ06_022369 [Pogonophryne albipinna]|uniref:Uncharacterized protein n=1 Tax=Pogonophryne albipinna TaxID=1090488 RepID=A0AAD6A837_9TELE|nr:hypothetical protein JOQ06_022369 [Pogonophryne albipinna]